MVDFKKLSTTLAYARLGLVSLSATIIPITVTAQELCGRELFEGEPDAAALMRQTTEFLNILESNGIVAFEGREGRMTIDAVRRSLQDGVGSATLLACVVNSESIEFATGSGNQVIACGSVGTPSPFGQGSSATGSSAGRLFCTTETAAFSQYLGSEA